MDREGELTSKQLITIIILIISFSVILLFFFFLDFKTDIDKETCRNSVVLRGTAPFGKENVQLSCKTKDVCITRKEGCENNLADTRVIKVNNKEELLDEFSELMYDCWWQMGAGKINYAPRGWEGQYCVVCNTIQISESVKDSDFAEINLQELFSTLQNRKNSEGQSYLYSMYQVNSLGAALDRLGNNNDILRDTKIDLRNPQKYALITSITDGADMKTTFGAMGVGVGVGAYFGPWGILLGGTAGFASGFFITSGDNIYAPPQVYTFDAPTLNKLKCKEFSSRS